MEFIQYHKNDHIAWITINRPEVLNALNPPARKELDAIWEDFKADPELWVAVITGSGQRAFCVGDDLKYRAAKTEEKKNLESAELPRYGPSDCYKPVIAAVNGFAVGGGLELVLGCDIVVASAEARFGLPEARRGLLADGGGLVHLPRQLPYHIATAMIFSGKLFSAEEMHRAGLVIEITPPGRLRETAESWAREVLACSPLAIQAAKDVILTTRHLSPGEAEKALKSLPSVKRLRESEDYQEGPRAFAEKRPPVWKGY